MRYHHNIHQKLFQHIRKLTGMNTPRPRTTMFKNFRNGKIWSWHCLVSLSNSSTYFIITCFRNYGANEALYDNMYNQHKQMRQDLQDRHQQMANDINECKRTCMC